MRQRSTHVPLNQREMVASAIKHAVGQTYRVVLGICTALAGLSAAATAFFLQGATFRAEQQAS